ncbi:pleckstrin homology domain-containing family D member 1 isoform X3 [Oryzias latipes]|uniref:pleckstrin homology domain-containing family D member 1 isoform X3 n=1 Tax=Oryzias latipes TaxID=8090 RepID=UPI0009D96B16|nr:pleckstrin homology domain-containing family D member 1 isoform X3 [Oryzias latipes]
MDVTGEISQNEMLEKIAELDHSQSQLRDSNVRMMHLLDAADDEIVLLRSDNATLRKQLEASLKNVISEVPQVEVEPCMFSTADVNSCSEKKVHDLEKEASDLKQQNKELTEQLKDITEERDQNKTSLGRMGAAFERGMEEAQLELQQKDELIHQKELQLKHLSETMEEYCDIIKDLRLTKQQLTEQLEERREEASLVMECMRAEEGSPSPQLSIAEEILLASPCEVTPEPEFEKNQEEEAPATKTSTVKFVIFWTTAQKTRSVLINICCLFVFAVILIVCCLLFTCVRPLMPFIALSYTAPPPV